MAQGDGSTGIPCALPADEIASQGGLTVGALGLTPGALGLTPGALGLTPGALALTPGALGLTPGALALTPGGLGLTPGALSESDQALIQQLVEEILNNPINSQWLLNLAPSYSTGFMYGARQVVIIVADDFEDPGFETEFMSHGELVEQIYNELLTDAGVNYLLVRVDITEGQDFVVNDDPGTGQIGIATRIYNAVESHKALGYTRFILSMSFGLIPCDDAVMLDSGKVVNFNINDFVEQRELELEPDPVDVFFECVAFNDDESLTAHFGYVNPNDYPLIIPPGEGNFLQGGGLSYDQSDARTPFYFGVPQDNPDLPHGSLPYPNSAFQVEFYSFPLTWYAPDGDVIVVDYESASCPSVPEASSTVYAGSVVSYNPGLQSNGTAVPTNRSDPSKALGAPENVDTLNFVSLGFGGVLILELENVAYPNPEGPDLTIVETTWGGLTFAQYPEQADIFVSQTGGEGDWTYLGLAQLDASFELPEGLGWFKYVKFVDRTAESWNQASTNDGFDVDGVIAYTAPQPVIPILECIAFDPDNEAYIVHFGFENQNAIPVTILHGFEQNVLLEGYGEGEVAYYYDEGFDYFQTPTLFGVPNVLPEGWNQPGRTQFYPNSAFQVAFWGGVLEWWLMGPDGVLRVATADTNEGPFCEDVTPVNDFTVLDYLGGLGGVTPEEAEETLMKLISNPDLDDPNLNALIPLLRQYLADSAAGGSDFALIPFAASGNTRPLLGGAPLAPARFKETIAVGALLGQNPGTFADDFSHDGNVAAPGAWYQFIFTESVRLVGAGTSYATPFAGAFAAPFLTYDDPDTCNFVDPSNLSGGRVPLVGNEMDFINARFSNESSPLDCTLPVEPPPVPTCNGIPATIYVEDGVIFGGPHDGKPYKGKLFGTNGDDVMVGTDGEDDIRGKNGNDVICGLDGNDKLRGDNGNDMIFGGLDNDTITGGNDNDTLYGGTTDLPNDPSGNDRIYGENGDDVIHGGDGEDLLHGGHGNDQIFGGTEHDHIRGDKGDDILDGGDHNDVIHGGDGSDTVNGGPGEDLLYGGDDDDVINGGDDNDKAWGGKGNDIVNGDEGDDKLWGNYGDEDVLNGGNGNDTLKDEDGVVGAHGGPGNDHINVTLRKGWLGGADHFEGMLSGGYDDDEVILKTLYPACETFFIDITGDEYDDPPSVLEGTNDKLWLRGKTVHPDSVIIKFETVVDQSDCEHGGHDDDDDEDE